MPIKPTKIERLSSSKKKSNQRFSNIQVLLITCVCIAALILISKLKIFSNESSEKHLRYWSMCIENWNPNGNLRTMHRVFDRLNIKKSGRSGWDIAWSIEGPTFAAYKNIKKFKIYQKANHFPGNKDLVNKMQMCYASSNSKYILPCFMMPEEYDEFQGFLKRYPKSKFVQKNMYNRGVKLVDAKNIQTTEADFFQVFLDNPFLIDGHAFDIGVFVLISSINPLRIYRHDHEILLRFCAKKYHPFDPEDTDRYVVQDGHKSFYEMQAFGDDYRKYAGSMKHLFERYLRMRGFNVKKMWEEMDKAIVTLVKNSEDLMIQTVGHF